MYDVMLEQMCGWVQPVWKVKIVLSHVKYTSDACYSYITRHKHQ